MSSFKKLSKADVTNVPYAANKQWNLSYSCPSISNGYFNIYKGTYITGTFSPNNYATDPITNGQYERLVYNSINHLFYQSYSGSLLNTGSLMFNVDTYTSASQQRPTGAYFDYNTNPLLIKNFPTGAYQADCREYTITYTFGIDPVTYIYTDCAGNTVSPISFVSGYQTFCAISGSINVLSGNYTLVDNGICIASSSRSGIRVLAINQDIYGSKILPNSFRLSSSVYDIKDDGNGNLYSGSTHIGNIFYAHGLAVITNQDYQNMFPLPPIAVNDSATYLTSDSTTKVISILQNDISRSCALDTGSVVLSGSNSQYYTVNANGTITLNYSASGNYDVYYTVNSLCGNGCSLTSNKAKVSVDVVQVTPPPCITVEFHGGKPSQTFYYVVCGNTITSSLSLNDTDAPVQVCIDGAFGVSGSTFYNVIGGCVTPPTSCINYTLDNYSGGTISYSYTDCNGVSHSSTLASNASLSVCAFENSFTFTDVEGVYLTNNDACSTCATYELTSQWAIDTPFLTASFSYTSCSGDFTTEIVSSSAKTRCIDPSYSIIKTGFGSINYVSPTCVAPSGSNVYVHVYSKLGNKPFNSTTASIYYTTGSGGVGPYTLLGSIWDQNCSDLGTIPVTVGSTLYIGILSGSKEVAYGAIGSASCAPYGTTSYCGTSSMYSMVINQNEDISVQAKVPGGVLAIC